MLRSAEERVPSAVDARVVVLAKKCNAKAIWYRGWNVDARSDESMLVKFSSVPPRNFFKLSYGIFLGIDSNTSLGSCLCTHG